ncbi:MAG: DUF4124 domain-containing protein [Gammaproteobacteria bacterium]|nr:DUF4124 domain-containing protein [Gammaproteobacteria bacterium]
MIETRAARLFALLFAAGCAVQASAGPTLYKSITPEGKVVYSDRPATGATSVRRMKIANAPTTALPPSAAEQLRKLESLRPAPREARGAVLYTAAWCGYCRKAKAYLAAKGIAFREVDIETPDGLAAFARDGGGKGVPVLVLGKTRIEGFSVEAYDGTFAGR